MTEVLLQPLQHSRGKELSTRSLARALFSFEAFGLSFNPAACRWKKKLDRIILSLEMKSSLSIHTHKPTKRLLLLLLYSMRAAHFFWARAQVFPLLVREWSQCRSLRRALQTTTAQQHALSILISFHSDSGHKSWLPWSHHSNRFTNTTQHAHICVYICAV
jgi:hypothetical protein